MSADALDHPDADVRSRRLTDLAETGALTCVGVDRARVVRQVERLVEDTDPQVAANAAFALGKIGTRATVPTLLGALRRARDRDAHLSRQILIALFDLTDGEDAGVLEPGLTSVLRDVREIGVDLIAHTSDKTALAVLARHYGEEEDPAILGMLADRLRRQHGG